MFNQICYVPSVRKFVRGSAIVTFFFIYISFQFDKNDLRYNHRRSRKKIFFTDVSYKFIQRPKNLQSYKTATEIEMINELIEREELDYVE